MLAVCLCPTNNSGDSLMTYSLVYLLTSSSVIIAIHAEDNRGLLQARGFLYHNNSACGIHSCPSSPEPTDMQSSVLSEKVSFHTFSQCINHVQYVISDVKKPVIVYYKSSLSSLSVRFQENI